MGLWSQALIYPQDLRLRLVTVVSTLVAITSLQLVWPALACLVGVMSLYAVFHQPFPWRRLIHLEIFLLLLFITLPFSLPGTPLFRLGPWTASSEGVMKTGVIVCKVLASVMLIALFIASTEPLRLGIALRNLWVPEKLVQLLITMLRYLGVIQAEYSRLVDAMRMRSFRPRSGFHTWRCYGYLFGMLLVRAMERAERVEEAMRMRSFSGCYPATDFPAPSLRDWMAMVGIIACAVILVLWDSIWSQ